MRLGFQRILIPTFICIWFVSVAVAQTPLSMRISPAALVAGQKVHTSLSVQLEISDAYDRHDLHALRFCLEVEDECHALDEDGSRFYRNARLEKDGKISDQLVFEELKLPKEVLKQVFTRAQSRKQGDAIDLSVNAIDPAGNTLASSALHVYPPVSMKVFRTKKKKGKPKRRIKRVVISSESSRPSLNFKNTSSWSSESCDGTDNVSDSLGAYLDCFDNALLVTCAGLTGDDQGGCLYDACGGKFPQDVMNKWREINKSNVSSHESSGSQFYWKYDSQGRAFGSSASSTFGIKMQLNPCLYDGRVEMEGNFYVSPLIMDYGYSLIQSYYRLLHPGKSSNINLSQSLVRMGSEWKTLIQIEKNEFGQNTAPLSYYWEVFTSTKRTKNGLPYEGDDSLHWIGGVIPVYAYYKLQGYMGFEVNASVLPVTRIIDFKYNAYGDYGSGFGAGPARNGVQSVSYSGVASLFQAETKHVRFVSPNATNEGMLPSFSDTVQIEHWKPNGQLRVCGEWFPTTQHPSRTPLQCDYVIDLGALTDRLGSIRTIDDGSARIIQYWDDSSGQSPPPAQDAQPFPYRSPILGD